METRIRELESELNAENRRFAGFFSRAKGVIVGVVLFRRPILSLPLCSITPATGSNTGCCSSVRTASKVIKF